MRNEENKEEGRPPLELTASAPHTPPAEINPQAEADKLLEEAKRVRDAFKYSVVGDLLLPTGRGIYRSMPETYSNANLLETHKNTVNVFQISTNNQKPLDLANNPLAFCIKSMSYRKEIYDIEDFFSHIHRHIFIKGWEQDFEAAEKENNFQKLEAILENFRSVKKNREILRAAVSDICKLQKIMQIEFPEYLKNEHFNPLYDKLESNPLLPIDAYEKYQKDMQSLCSGIQKVTHQRALFQERADRTIKQLRRCPDFEYQYPFDRRFTDLSRKTLAEIIGTRIPSTLDSPNFLGYPIVKGYFLSFEKLCRDIETALYLNLIKRLKVFLTPKDDNLLKSYEERYKTLTKKSPETPEDFQALGSFFTELENITAFYEKRAQDDIPKKETEKLRKKAVDVAAAAMELGLLTLQDQYPGDFLKIATEETLAKFRQSAEKNQPLDLTGNPLANLTRQLNEFRAIKKLHPCTWDIAKKSVHAFCEENKLSSDTRLKLNWKLYDCLPVKNEQMLVAINQFVTVTLIKEKFEILKKPLTERAKNATEELIRFDDPTASKQCQMAEDFHQKTMDKFLAENDIKDMGIKHPSVQRYFNEYEEFCVHIETLVQQKMIQLSEEFGVKMTTLLLQTTDLPQDKKIETRNLLAAIQAKPLTAKSLRELENFQIEAPATETVSPLESSIQKAYKNAHTILSSLKPLEPFLNITYHENFLFLLAKAQQEAKAKNNVQPMLDFCKESESHAIRAGLCSMLMNAINNLLTQKDTLHLSSDTVWQLEQMQSHAEDQCFVENILGRKQFFNDDEFDLILTRQNGFIISTRTELLNMLFSHAEQLFHEIESVLTDGKDLNFVKTHGEKLKQLFASIDANHTDTRNNPKKLENLLEGLTKFIAGSNAVIQTVDFQTSKARKQIEELSDTDTRNKTEKELKEALDTQQTSDPVNLEELHKLNEYLNALIEIEQAENRQPVLDDIIKNLLEQKDILHLSKKHVEQLKGLDTVFQDDDFKNTLIRILHIASENILKELEFMSTDEEYNLLFIKQKKTLDELMCKKNSYELITDLSFFLKKTDAITQTIYFQEKKTYKQIAELPEEEKTTPKKILSELIGVTEYTEKLKQLNILNAWLQAKKIVLDMARFLYAIDKDNNEKFLKQSHESSIEMGTPEPLDTFIENRQAACTLPVRCMILMRTAKKLYDAGETLQLSEEECATLLKIQNDGVQKCELKNIQGSAKKSQNAFFDENFPMLLEIMIGTANKTLAELGSQPHSKNIVRERIEALNILQTTKIFKHNQYEIKHLAALIKELEEIITKSRAEISPIVRTRLDVDGTDVKKQKLTALAAETKPSLPTTKTSWKLPSLDIGRLFGSRSGQSVTSDNASLNSTTEIRPATSRGPGSSMTE